MKPFFAIENTGYKLLARIHGPTVTRYRIESHNVNPINLLTDRMLDADMFRLRAIRDGLVWVHHLQTSEKVEKVELGFEDVETEMMTWIMDTEFVDPSLDLEPKPDFAPV